MKAMPIEKDRQKSKQLKCSICGNEFGCNEYNLKHRAYACGIEEDYFQCPFCGLEYIGLRTDEESRKWCKERDAIIDQLKQSHPPKEHKRLQDEYAKVVEKIKIRSKSLKSQGGQICLK